MYYFLHKYPGRTIVFANSIACVRRFHGLFSLLSLPVRARSCFSDILNIVFAAPSGLPAALVDAAATTIKESGQIQDNEELRLNLH